MVCSARRNGLAMRPDAALVLEREVEISKVVDCEWGGCVVAARSLRLWIRSGTPWHTKVAPPTPTQASNNQVRASTFTSSPIFSTRAFFLRRTSSLSSALTGPPAALTRSPGRASATALLRARERDRTCCIDPRARCSTHDGASSGRRCSGGRASLSLPLSLSLSLASPTPLCSHAAPPPIWETRARDQWDAARRLGGAPLRARRHTA